MEFIDHIRYRLDRALWPAVLITILAYFAFHSVSGRYGLLALRDMERELADLEVISAELAAQRAGLAHKVSLLRPDNLDPELLGERARAILGYALPGEKAILHTK